MEKVVHNKQLSTKMPNKNHKKQIENKSIED